MSLELINPHELAPPAGFTHVAVGSGSRLVFIAGQVAEDRNGMLVGPGNMECQARQAFANLGHALAAGGARPDQVCKITIFVAHYHREHLPAIEAGRASLFGDHTPPDTLVGVAALSKPGFMIEVDAVALMA
jgi:enamine deaminase RidA (YjgF/YER057c/UK114 family)